LRRERRREEKERKLYPNTKKKQNLNCEEERSWIFGSLKWFILNQRVSLGRKKKERKKKNTNKKERKKP
jgi:hypothetical protein